MKRPQCRRRVGAVNSPRLGAEIKPEGHKSWLPIRACRLSGSRQTSTIIRGPNLPLPVSELNQLAATLEPPGGCFVMEYRGFRYELLQMTSPSGWKWIVHLGPTKTQTGFSRSKEIAAFAATRAIDKALKATTGENGNRVDGATK